VRVDTAVVVLGGAASASASPGTLATYGVVLLAGGGLLGSVLTNLSGAPLEANPDRAVVAQRDGWTARRAFALHRQGASPPTAASAPTRAS
jgi:hypothetical protein